MKLIALDVGTKRIGVAKADTSVRIAIPYAAVEVNGGEEFKKIASLARAWDINNFVLGLPRNSEGQETKQSLYVRQFAKKLRQVLPSAKICFQDESLTSVEAEKRLKGRKKGFKKGDIDSEAAAIILQDFIEEKTGKTTSVAASTGRKSVKGAKPHRWLAGIITLIVLLGLAGGAAWWFYVYNLRPMSEITCDGSIYADECNDIAFSVEPGLGITEVANRLEEQGLIRNSLMFRLYFKLNSGGNQLKSGDYKFNKSMSVESIAGLLLHGSDSVYTLTFLPGETLAEIQADLVKVGYSVDEAKAALSADYSTRDFAWVFEGRPADTTLEGYLFGDTYEFYRDGSAETIVARLIEELAQNIKDHHLEEKFAAHGLNLYEGITLASVVQKEANTPADMQKVAQVFLNRLAAGMTLGSDVTAIYAADLVDPERQVYNSPAAVIEIDSPYNTRKHGGLPYGPVSNPSLAALTAVAEPDTSMAETLFFLTGDDGLMYYSDTEAGHQQNILDHCQTLCNIDI